MAQHNSIASQILTSKSDLEKRSISSYSLKVSYVNIETDQQGIIIWVVINSFLAILVLYEMKEDRMK